MINKYHLLCSLNLLAAFSEGFQSRVSVFCYNH